jgi:hypothetical protein
MSPDGLRQGNRRATVRHRPKFGTMPRVDRYSKVETTEGWEGRGGEASKGDVHRSLK